MPSINGGACTHAPCCCCLRLHGVSRRALLPPPPGRGFSITTSQFVKLFANYSRSHLYLGAELVFHALVLFIVGPDCAEVRASTRRI